MKAADYQCRQIQEIFDGIKNDLPTTDPVAKLSEGLKKCQTLLQELKSGPEGDQSQVLEEVRDAIVDLKVEKAKVELLKRLSPDDRHEKGPKGGKKGKCFTHFCALESHSC